ncbi:MAG: glycerophosphodiester phosphodiesterase [Pirellulaceae bacterium]|nr:glycerophosphodiester phosphodiesterase [Pirellulaceae bacterium]
MKHFVWQLIFIRRLVTAYASCYSSNWWPGKSSANNICRNSHTTGLTVQVATVSLVPPYQSRESLCRHLVATPFLLILSLVTAARAAETESTDNRVQPAGRPIVIAHRGASGYLPEHTLVAKAAAHAMGADYLEQDVVLSKDDVPVVLHDIYIDTVTDVAQQFPDRHRQDGRFYALDFTVQELKQLSVTERVELKTGKAVFPNRFPARPTTLQLCTLDEELEFIAGLNRSTGREAGIYPEIKNPYWHHQQGRDLSRAVLEVLTKHGYSTKQHACWLQCFEFQEIKRLRSELGWQGRLVQLLVSRGKNVDGTDYRYLLSDEGLTELSQWVDGIGPEVSSFIQGNSPQTRQITSLVAQAHRQGLQVHPYTLRQDALPRCAASLDDLHRAIFVDAKADGVFSDFPDKTAEFVKQLATDK